MNNKTKAQILSGLLASTMFLSACGKKSECEIPSRHVHRYTKQVTSEISLEEYIDSEKLEHHGFNWNPDYIEINKHDEELYKVLNNKLLFSGVNNWDYLYNTMVNNNEDYLMFYYEYYTTEIYSTTDANGNISTYTQTVRHDGWHSNPHDSDNTGDVRLYHHQFFGYRVISINGNYVLEKSPLVDDIRDVIEEYPYFSQDCVEEVYASYKFSRYELGSLKPEDFNDFEHPNLENAKILELK